MIIWYNSLNVACPLKLFVTSSKTKQIFIYYERSFCFKKKIEVQPTPRYLLQVVMNTFNTSISYIKLLTEELIGLIN